MQSLIKCFSLVGLCCFFLFSGSLQAAEGLIEEVSFHGKDENSESVTFRLNGPHLPKVFSISGDNSRVVFDFMGTQLARTVPVTIDAGGSMVQKIRLGRHENKTRAVIDLVPGGDFNFEQKFDEVHNVLTIQLFSANVPEKQEEKLVVAIEQQEEVPEQQEAPESASVENVVEEEVVGEEVVAEDVVDGAPVVQENSDKKVEETGAAADESDPSPEPLLSNVTFENTSNKGEMVLFKLNGFYPPVVSGEEDENPQVICDFTGTRLGDGVVKELASNGDYIRRVRIEQLNEPDLIRVTLDLVANKNYDLQQVFFKEDNLFVIIVNSYDALTIPKK
ncbi:MAG: AMIN domain-containing protein [Desulfocapsa sp.]|nr:AMIN domain-containing protein [Desulfocapsa sp.]